MIVVVVAAEVACRAEEQAVVPMVAVTVALEVWVVPWVAAKMEEHSEAAGRVEAILVGCMEVAKWAETLEVDPLVAAEKVRGEEIEEALQEVWMGELWVEEVAEEGGQAAGETGRMEVATVMVEAAVDSGRACMEATEAAFVEVEGFRFDL